MANPHRGETSVEIGGKVYTLRLTTNELCQVEELLDRDVAVLMSQLARFSTVRALFWAATRERHPELTLKDVGELMHEHRVGAFMKAVSDAMAAAFPKPEPTENPQMQDRP